MKMARYYFISKDLDDLESFEVDLEKQGISTERSHCLSLDDTSAENHLKLHDVAGLMKKDLMHAGSYGLAVGIVVAIPYSRSPTSAAGQKRPQDGCRSYSLRSLRSDFLRGKAGYAGFRRRTCASKVRRAAACAGRHVFCRRVGGRDSIIASTAKSYPKVQAAGLGTAGIRIGSSSGTCASNVFSAKRCRKAAESAATTELQADFRFPAR
jgi:hypothetical protein